MGLINYFALFYVKEITDPSSKPEAGLAQIY